MAELGDLETRLAEIKRAYVAELPTKAADLEAVWRRVQTQDWQPAPVQELHRMAHSLAGSGATFGFAALSRSARTLEISVASLAHSETADVAAARAEIPLLVVALLMDLRCAAEAISPDL
jgi:HPt (histidine-containing phosphotransfer) domain-containing protein